MSKNDNLGAGEIVGIAIGSAIVIGLIVGSQYNSNNSNNSNDIAEFVGTLGGINTPSVEKMTTLYNEGKIKDINVTYNDMTALMVQSASGSPEAITWLLENGADINFQNSEGYTALYFAIISKNTDNMKLLLTKRAKTIIKLTDGSQLNLNALIRENERKIIQEKNTETEKDSISEFVGTIGVNIPTLDKMTTLYDEGKIQDVNVLYNDMTALMVQSASGTREAIEWLQSKGANPNIKNKEGETALDLAIKFRNIEAQNLLGDININKDFVGQLSSEDTPTLDEMKELLEKNNMMDVNVTYNGLTALMVQSRYGTIETMKWLLENGADTNIKNSNGRTALWYAVAANDNVKVKLLLDHEANPEILDNTGKSILNYAVKTKKTPEIITILKSYFPAEAEELEKEQAQQAEAEKVEKEQAQQAIEKERLKKEQAQQAIEKKRMEQEQAQQAIEAERLATQGKYDESDKNRTDSAFVGGVILPKLADMQGMLREKTVSNVNVRNKGRNNITALMNQTSRGQLDSMKWLLDNGANPDLQDDSGETALHFAVNKSDIDKVRLLLNRGADQTILNKKGDTPEDLANKSLQMYETVITKPDLKQESKEKYQRQIQKFKTVREALSNPEISEGVGRSNATASGSSVSGGKRVGNKKFTVSRFGYTRRKTTNNNKSKKIKPNKIKSKKNKI